MTEGWNPIFVACSLDPHTVQYNSTQAAAMVFLWLQCQGSRSSVCMDSVGTGCSWAAERSWHAPLSHGLRRLRPRRRQGWWWMGCRPCLSSSFDRAAVICYRATVASINFWHMHTCTLTTTDLPLLHIQSHSFWLQGKGTRQSKAQYLNVFTLCALFKPNVQLDFFSSKSSLFSLFFCGGKTVVKMHSHCKVRLSQITAFQSTSWLNHRVKDLKHLSTARCHFYNQGYRIHSRESVIVCLLLLGSCWLFPLSILLFFLQVVGHLQAPRLKKWSQLGKKLKFPKLSLSAASKYEGISTPTLKFAFSLYRE